MLSPYADEQYQENQTQSRILLNSIYWGVLAALWLYCVSRDYEFLVVLRGYLKQILPLATPSEIVCLYVIGSILLLMMASSILKYICFGKNLHKILIFAVTIVVLHTTICIYGMFVKPEKKAFFAEPGGAKMMRTKGK